MGGAATNAATAAGNNDGLAFKQAGFENRVIGHLITPHQQWLVKQEWACLIIVVRRLCPVGQCARRRYRRHRVHLLIRSLSRECRAAATFPPCCFHHLARVASTLRSEEHTSELQSRGHLVCRLLLEKKKIVI